MEFLLCHTRGTSRDSFYNPVLGESEKDGKKVTTRAVYYKESMCLVSEILTRYINTNSSQHQYYKTRSKPGLINFKEKIMFSALKD